MEVQTIEVVRFPLDTVFETFRDEAPALAAHIPNVSRIEVLERSERDDGRTDIVNHWYAVSDIPLVLRGVLKPEMLGWKDIATWDNDAQHADWRLETFFFAEAVSCSGRTSFVAQGARHCKVTIDLNLQIDAGRIPGVPRALRGSGGAKAEKLIAGMIAPNLGKAAAGVQALLESRAG